MIAFKVILAVGRASALELEAASNIEASLRCQVWTD